MNSTRLCRGAKVPRAPKDQHQSVPALEKPGSQREVFRRDSQSRRVTLGRGSLPLWNAASPAQAQLFLGPQAPGRSGSRAGRGGGRPLCRQAAVTPRPVHGLGGRRDFLLMLTFSGHELSPLRARKSIFYEIIPLEVKRRSTISPGRRNETCLHGY